MIVPFYEEQQFDTTDSVALNLGCMESNVKIKKEPDQKRIRLSPTIDG